MTKRYAFENWIVAAPAAAQVPQDMTYTGRLVDIFGAPLPGPVKITLRIFDSETSGVEFYSEEHLDVVLDATGGFSVRLGLGTNPSEPFSVDIFSGLDRWLEVQIENETMTPRQIIGSVPWAMVAAQANEIVRDPTEPRFERCVDGTVADHKTGLQWEEKTGVITTPNCGGSCPSVHDVNNRYSWSDNLPDPDGSAYSVFLESLNGDDANGYGCYGNHCDWRLPKIAEWQTIMIGPGADLEQPQICPGSPCIDPAFAVLAGPTVPLSYWSDTSTSFGSGFAYYAFFQDGTIGANNFNKTLPVYVRAVRSGTCH